MHTSTTTDLAQKENKLTSFVLPIVPMIPNELQHLMQRIKYFH